MCDHRGQLKVGEGFNRNQAEYHKAERVQQPRVMCRQWGNLVRLVAEIKFHARKTLYHN
jgi:hypothetical protein